MDSTRSKATKCVQRSWTHEVDFATKSRAERAEGEVERGNHLQRIHDRGKHKVFHAKRGSKTRQKTKPQVSVLMPGSAQRGASRVKNREFKIKMVVGDGFEPSNSERADLQSAAFDRSAIPPHLERVTGVEPV